MSVFGVKPCTDIADIDNLVGFRNLVKLQLDNNRITEIKNLSHLTNLTWLGALLANCSCNIADVELAQICPSIKYERLKV